MRKLSDEREAVISAAELVGRTVHNTALLVEEQERVEQDLARAAARLTQAIMRNASIALDQEQHHRDMEVLSKRYQELLDRNKTLKQEIQDKENRHKRTTSFIRELRRLPEQIDRFDPVAFRVLVEKITVYSKQEVLVLFRDGTEILA